MAEQRVRDGNDFAGRLLRAGLRDAPRPGAAARIAAAIAASGTATGLAAASTTTTAAAATAGGAAKTSVLGSLSLLQSFVLGVAIGGASIGAIRVAGAGAPDATPPAHGVTSEKTRARALPQTAPRATTAESQPERVERAPGDPQPPPARKAPVASKAPSTEVSRAEPLISGATPPTAAVEPSRLPVAAEAPGAQDTVSAVAREIAVIDGVRAAIAAGRPEDALRSLDQHQHTLRTLWVEAEVARVEALTRAGRVAEARAVGGRFVQKYPNTAHAARIRQVLAR